MLCIKTDEAIGLVLVLLAETVIGDDIGQHWIILTSGWAAFEILNALVQL